MKIKPKLLSKDITCCTFSVKDLIHTISIPDYQRNIVWTRDQRESFVRDCVFSGSPIPPMMLLCVRGKDGNKIKPKDCYLIDGLQRRHALLEFVSDVLSVLYEGVVVKFSTLTEKYRNKVLEHQIVFNYIKGTHADGNKWLDNEQKRVSHTSGDYIYRHRFDRDIARMAYDIVNSTYSILNQFLDSSACYGNYVIQRVEDYYPFIVSVIALKLDLINDKSDMPTCWPDRQGVLWLDRDEIMKVKYDPVLVNDLISQITEMKKKYTLQILPTILTQSKKHTSSYCQAFLKGKNKKCGFKAKYTNKYHNAPCCGFHTKEHIRFE